MKEIVEKKEVEELLGCEITDEQFEEALKYARHKQEYICQRERRQVVLQHWYLEAHRGICEKPCFFKIHYGFMQNIAGYGKRAPDHKSECPYE